MQIGRKNVHGKGGVRFKTPYTSSKKKAQVRNLVTELVIYEKVTVTHSMVKPVIKEFDHLVTLAKKGDLHSIRQAASILKKYNVANKPEALTKLFKDLSTRFASRNGGYLKVYKLENRKGDNAEVRMLTLAD
ncbi:MAG: 50S ribosomal protein L17 [Bacilli bacterium]|nr:50S ribosomal protein L17 [Mollicutes bacterium]MDD6469458.1 50S ribosomal protein L17 [Bacilli bacterium]MDY3761784.1 50S ribosomal protein L17 [Candidatus Onthovivens sp.]MCI6615136.1 50S ribosomal protein L17 [Mollicutes bacterium]MCI7039814.1 50S ribosomal protein L17 [Mollicutes bacterium]